MTDATMIADRYIAAWNERDAPRRRALLAESWTEDAQYVDPLMQGSGHDAIDAMIAGVQQRFPDGRFRLRGTPEAHNDRLRFGWTLDLGDAVAEGTDFAILAADGRLRSVTGFLDRMPG